MDAETIAQLAIALLEGVPSILATVQNIRGDLSAETQAQVDAAIAGAHSAAVAAVAQADAALGQGT